MALGGKTGSFSLWAYPDPLTGDRLRSEDTGLVIPFFQEMYGELTGIGWAGGTTISSVPVRIRH